MIRKAGVLSLCAFTLVATGALFADGAAAGPPWKFEHSELLGEETIVGNAPAGTLTVPGLTTTCDFSYGMTIANFAGTAHGEIGEMSISNCSTNASECSIKSTKAENLPWSLHGSVVGVHLYVVIEGIKFSLLYAGENCALDEISVVHAGSAGGLYDNTAGTFAFSQASFTATKTKMAALKATLEWGAVFSTEALGPHKGQRWNWASGARQAVALRLAPGLVRRGWARTERRRRR